MKYSSLTLLCAQPLHRTRLLNPRIISVTQTLQKRPNMSVSSHHAIPERQAQKDDPRETVINRPAAGIPYFTPAQVPPSGTAFETQSSGKAIPKLFQPLTVRGCTFQNRIMLSPLCQYSAEDGHLTMWHFTHLGGIIQRGPGLAMVEATAVVPEGRITPEDSGLWKDSQIEPLRKIVEFAHSQGQKIGLQVAHAGRKASTVAPWLRSGNVATKEVNGWPDNVYGPSAIKWNEDHAPVKEMTLADIEYFKTAWVAGIQRALKAGFDVIEIHNAHGYLLHSFLSPATNHRTDRYGGTFENRTRLTREIVQLTRQAIPDSMPLFLRISATDWLDEVAKSDSSAPQESWTVADTVRLADELADLGVDVLDVSSGGNHPKQHPHTGPAYQAPFAHAVKEKCGDRLHVMSVGSITTGPQAEELMQKGLDMVACGRTFQKDPGLVWTFAEQLGVEINLANQIRWGFGIGKSSGRGKKA